MNKRNFFLQNICTGHIINLQAHSQSHTTDRFPIQWSLETSMGELWKTDKITEIVISIQFALIISLTQFRKPWFLLENWTVYKPMINLFGCWNVVFSVMFTKALIKFAGENLQTTGFSNWTMKLSDEFSTSIENIN